MEPHSELTVGAMGVMDMMSFAKAYTNTETNEPLGKWKIKLLFRLPHLEVRETIFTSVTLTVFDFN